MHSYFERIGYSGPAAADESTMAAVHRAQSARIPFENIDIHLGRRIALDEDALFEKLVLRQRGGYCYELNLLLAGILRRLGFTVVLIAARTRLNAIRLLPRTHMVLLVGVNSREWIVDAGFGVYGLSGPVPFVAGSIHDTGYDRYRIVRTGSWYYVLQCEAGHDWMTLYEFTGEPLPPEDFEIMNYYNSTSPDSRFRQSVVAARVDGDCRTVLNGRTLRQSSRNGTQERVLQTQSAYEAALRSEFGIVLGESVSALFALTPLHAHA